MPTPVWGGGVVKKTPKLYCTDRIDKFFFSHMLDTEYDKVLTVIKLLMVLSHGQASVERGFSVNKKVEVENLGTQFLVAQRMICDHVKSVEGVLKVSITQKLLKSASAARLTLKAPRKNASENVVCWSRLLQIFA